MDWPVGMDAYNAKPSAAAGKFRRRHRTIPHYQLARETKRNETKLIQHRDEVLDLLRPLHSSQL